LEKIHTDYNVYAKLCYGKEFWDEIGHSEVWVEVLNYLERWKKEIPDMPEIDFEKNAENTFAEIKDIDVSSFRKLFYNHAVCREILPILFPQNKVLQLLYNYYMKKADEKSIYKTLATRIKEIIV
jgi:hypothetical protein